MSPSEQQHREGESYRIDISNPGGLVKGMSPKDLGKKSVLRNPNIASLLHRVGYIEKMGTGVTKMRKLIREAGLLPPLFESGYFFTATFRRPGTKGSGRKQPPAKGRNEGVNGGVNRLYSFICDHPRKRTSNPHSYAKHDAAGNALPDAADICLRSGDALLLIRRGLGVLCRPAARHGLFDHLDDGHEKQTEVPQLAEVVTVLPVLQATCQRLARGLDGQEGRGRPRRLGDIGLGGLLQEFRQLLVGHGIFEDALEDGHKPWVFEVGGEDVALGDGNGPRFDGIAYFLLKHKQLQEIFYCSGRLPDKLRGKPNSPVVLLTGTELFSTRDIAFRWKGKGGLFDTYNQRSFELSELATLANVTQQLYLDLPSWHKSLEIEWEKRKQKKATTQKAV